MARAQQHNNTLVYLPTMNEQLSSQWAHRGYSPKRPAERAAGTFGTNRGGGRETIHTAVKIINTNIGAYTCLYRSWRGAIGTSAGVHNTRPGVVCADPYLAFAVVSLDVRRATTNKLRFVPYGLRSNEGSQVGCTKQA